MLPTTVLAWLTCLLVAGSPLAAQEPAAHTEEEQLESEYIQTRLDHGESHASGGRPELGPVVLGNPTSAVALLRVGLHWSFSSTGAFSEFATLNHPHVDVAHTAGDVHVIDRSTGLKVTTTTAGSVVRVTHGTSGYLVQQDGVALGAFTGPILFRPTSRENFFRIESIRRSFLGVRVPLYRGALEVARGPATLADRVNVVNLVEVESYVPGVVANESLASFAVEALKAQAVAARGYAIANVGNYVRRGLPFDIVDSAASQVYRGVISEHPNAVAAVRQTHGLVASYQGRIISALYSSSFGGHGEDNEWVFNFPSSQLPGTNAVPYLRGRYDGEGAAPDFSNEAGVASFWTTNPQPFTFDDCLRVGNGFSRWRIRLPATSIKSRLVPSRVVILSGDLSGKIMDIEIVRRMTASGRAAVARVTLTTGVAEVRGWDNLRNVLGRTALNEPRACGTSRIVPNFTLNNPSWLEIVRETDGTVREVFAYGGGWGHNLGMSQFGAHGRGRAGQTFLQILKAYYTDADIGSYPIDIGRDPGQGPPTLRQSFMAPNAAGVLEIRAAGLEGLRVHVNETYDLAFDAAALSADVVRVDLSPYLLPGMNVIQYNPVGRDGSATVAVLVH